MLYNTHLATLIEVVEAGSFRRAAEKVGISPSAVLKQITLLENELQVNLFDRSRKGVTLTEAGESVYHDAKYILQYCESTAERARELFTKQSNTVRIGFSVMNPVTPLLSFWPEIQKLCPEIKCHFTTFEPTRDGIERTFSTLGQDSDLVLSIYDDRFLAKYGLKALKLRNTSAVIASMPRSGESAAAEREIGMEELRNRAVLVPKRGRFETADAFRDDAERNYPSIHIEDFDMYSLDIFYRCQNEDKCIFTYDEWELGHMLLEQRKLRGMYQSCYGLIYGRNPSEPVVKLLTAMSTLLERPNTVSYTG